MALYPTQKKTWQTLQGIEGHEHDCGRPGINGGFIANPNVRFGINCFGYKPKITPEEQELMENTTPFPKTQKSLTSRKRLKSGSQNYLRYLLHHSMRESGANLNIVQA